MVDLQYLHNGGNGDCVNYKSLFLFLLFLRQWLSVWLQRAAFISTQMSLPQNSQKKKMIFLFSQVFLYISKQFVLQVTWFHLKIHFFCHAVQLYCCVFTGSLEIKTAGCICVKVQAGIRTRPQAPIWAYEPCLCWINPRIEYGRKKQTKNVKWC